MEEHKFLQTRESFQESWEGPGKFVVVQGDLPQLLQTGKTTGNLPCEIIVTEGEALKITEIFDIFGNATTHFVICQTQVGETRVQLDGDGRNRSREIVVRQP